MRAMLIPVAFCVGLLASGEAQQLGNLDIEGPIAVEDWHLKMDGEALTVEATLHNRGGWWIGELAVEVSAVQRGRRYYGEALQLPADCIGPGEKMLIRDTVYLLTTHESWDARVAPYGVRIDPPPTPHPTSTDVPTVEPTVTTRPTLTVVAPTATSIVVEPTATQPIRALVPYAERSPQ